jgi:hypothetical protein
MIVYPANNSHAHTLELVFPGSLGILFSPSGKRKPKNLPYALDNEMFSAWAKSGFAKSMEQQRAHWDSSAFLDALVWCGKQEKPPKWVVVPDVPGNAIETKNQFKVWLPHMEKTGFQLAMAVQDGMTPDDVPDGVVCFLGGTTEWKWQNLELFCENCPRVHVGRVNRYRHLWRCDDAGAESVDGSGFFRGDQDQLRGLITYLKESHGFLERIKQKKMFNDRLSICELETPAPEFDQFI